MVVDIPSNDPSDDDYIDIEIGSYTNFFCHSKSSPRQSREFEFQMSSNSRGREPTTSPADELFYNGKLLPLHHPPRLQMVEKLLQKSSSDYDYRKDIFEEFYSTPFTTSVNTPTSTPFGSCNISPSESFRISRELNPDEYLLELSADASYSNGESSKKSWTKKLKHCSLCLKLKASRAYIKSLFTKSGCSDESSAAATKIADEGLASKANECSKKGAKGLEKRKPSGQTPSSTANLTKENDNTDRSRRSFSIAIKRQPNIKPSYSAPLQYPTSSSCPNGSSAHFLKRCGSVNSEIENSIQGAIAHCKQSQSQQQPLRSRKTVSEVGIYLLSSSSTLAVSDDQEIPELCRG